MYRLMSAKAKMQAAESRRDEALVSKCPFPVELYGQCLIFPAVVCDNVPTREVHQALTCRLFIGAIHVAWSAHMADLSYSATTPYRGLARA